MNRERVAAALEFDRKRRAQDYLMSEPGTQPLTQGEDVLGFLRGVGGNLAGRAESAYSLATTPSRWIPEAQNVVTGLVELGKAAISDPAGTGRAIAQGEVQRASQAAGSPKEMGEYAANFIDPLRLAKALRYRGPIAELDVYHGTPHRFPGTEANPLGEFDASKIGTGEGAQAYGHGIYYAENPDVAKGYQSSLSADRGFSFEGKTGLTRAEVQDMVNAKYGKGYLDNILRPSGVADSFIDDMVTGVTRAEGAYPKQYKPGSERAKLYDELRGKITHASPGSLYKADLPDEMIDRMLDWDKPLSEQPKSVRQFFEPLVAPIRKAEAQGSGPEWGDFAAPRNYDPLGSELMQLLGRSDQMSAASVLSGGTGGAASSAKLQAAGIPGIRYLDAGSRGQGGSGTRNFVVFPSEEKKVKILERNGQPAPERIAQALEAAPSAFEQRLREQYGDFAQAYNLGLPDTPEYRRIVREVTAQGPLSDDALRKAIGAHPAYRQAGGKAAAAELRQSKRSGAAALVDSLSEQGIKTRVETSKSLGSRSTYIYASRGDKTVKIRLSDHLPAESGRVYGTNDIMTTPQHWKAAMKRALQLLEETE